MSERTSYQHGTPSWIDHSSQDAEAAVSFYKDMFGWDAENAMPDGEGKYFMCSKNGKRVAAVGSQQAEDAPAVWQTYITVDSADDTAGKVQAAGGTVVIEPFDVFDAGRMAVLTDPTGAFVNIWQAKDNIGAELVNESGALVWNELITRDVEAAKPFYAELFGWSTSEFPGGEGPPYTLVHLAGDDEPGMENVIGGMVQMTAEMFPPDVPPHWNAYVGVDDTDASVSRCEELGGSVMAPAMDMPWGRMAVLRDPQGASFTIIKMPEGQG